MSAEAFDIGRGYLGIEVECPFCLPGEPKPEHRRPLGIFIETELGQQILGPLVENAANLIKNGLSPDEAVDIAFGPAAARDEQGETITRSPEEVSTAKSKFNLGEFILEHRKESTGGSGSDLAPASGAPVPSETLAEKDSDSVKTDKVTTADKRVAENLRKLRLQKRLSPETLAQKIGINARDYAAIESGKSKPPPDTYARIIRALTV